MTDTLEARANTIASAANECCYRSDGYEEDITDLALAQLHSAVLAERERCAVIADSYATRVWDTSTEARLAAQHIAANIRGG